MKVVVPGGTGQVGTLLARALLQQGHEVVVLSRSPQAADWRMARWNGRTLGDWTTEIEGAGAIINLCGQSVNCRYNARNRAEIIRSRVESTRVVGEAIRRAKSPPPLWLQASTATIYSHRYDAPNDDLTGITGGSEPNLPETWRFSLEVARLWEEALALADTPATRKVALRMAMVMSPDAGGVFDTLLRLVKRGLGGPAGDGKQYVSWIHEADLVGAILHLMQCSQTTGAVALAAPNPVPNAEFMKALRDAWGAGVGLPASRWMLEMGALLMQTESELILKSRRVVPGRLLETGYRFRYPTWPEAARELCARAKGRT